MTYERLLSKLDTLENLLVGDGVLYDVEYMHEREGKTPEEIWEFFKDLDRQIGEEMEE